jgi:hypothetical protein
MESGSTQPLSCDTGRLFLEQTVSIYDCNARIAFIYVDCLYCLSQPLWSGAAYCDARWCNKVLKRLPLRSVSSMSSWHTKYEILLQQQCRPYLLPIHQRPILYQTKSSKVTAETRRDNCLSLHFIDVLQKYVTVSCCCQQAEVALPRTDLSKDVLEPVRVYALPA